MNCENCCFSFMPQKGSMAEYNKGYCQRYAPRPDFSTRVPDDDGLIPNVTWPVIFGTDWCGEWKSRDIDNP